jgi:hypothetical protein
MNKNNLVANIIKDIKNGVFVEIGTHVGDFANFILENSTNSILYCIDPYISYDNYDDAINNVTGDKLYIETYNKLTKKYGNRIKFIRKFSEEAVNDIPDNIDFLYIDGNHRYTYVLNDLKLYYSKVKRTCFIIGDDAVDTDDSKRNENGDVLINWGPGCYGNYGVIKAFREFCANNNLLGDIICNQFQIIKK